MIENLGRRRIWRVKELSSLIISLKSASQSDKAVVQRCCVVMCYAHWEGFFSDGIREIHGFFSEQKIPMSRISGDIVISALQSEFDRYLDGKGKRTLKREIVQKIKEKTHDPIGKDLTVLLPNSKLDYETACFALETLGTSCPFENDRIFIDKQLVKWRNKIAHGDYMRISEAENHVRKTIDLIDKSQECFNEIYSSHVA